MLLLLASAASPLVLAEQAANYPTTTRLSAGSDEQGRAVFTIKVEGGDRGVPSGAVTLSSGRASLGSVLLDENGSSTYTAAIGGGLKEVTAIYEGDDAFQTSSSLALTVPAVTSGVPTFTLSAAPTSLSVKAGNFVTSIVTVTPTNGFDGTVQLSCSGLPANSTCSFNPVNVVPNGTAPSTTAGSSILTIQTLAPSGAGTADRRSSGSPPGTVLAMLLPGLMALTGVGLLGRKANGLRRFVGLASLLVVCGLGLTACNPRYGYFHHPPNTDPGTTLGTFTVLISGSSASAGTVIIPTPVSMVLTVTAAQ